MTESVLVRYMAPHGEEVVSASDGEDLRFGRGGDCDIRFGHAPRLDKSIPRSAGRILIRDGRAWVHSDTEPGHRVLRIQTPVAAPEGLAHGEGRCPVESQFSILVSGDHEVYRLTLTQRPHPSVKPRADSGTIDGTTTHAVDLTERQRQVIRAYLAPLRRGRPEPSSHAEVATALQCGPNNVRKILYDVYDKLWQAGIPMPEHSDKRIAVVEAFRLHGLDETSAEGP